MILERVSVTDKAKAVIDQLRDKHGELIFHQSGGCCDGSAPMCFAKGDFLIGSRDLCLGEIHACKFYMASDQFEYKYLVPALRAGTRYLTGHREPHNQASLACTAHGAGQHRDSAVNE